MSGNLRHHHLACWQEEEATGLPKEEEVNKVDNPLSVAYPHLLMKNPDECVMGNIIMQDSKQNIRPTELDSGCVRANACKKIWFEPAEAKAAIVTVGHLCPGMNSIIRGITRSLWYDYGTKKIVGIQNGFNGLSGSNSKPVPLTPETTEEIHMKGGSILKAGTGGFDAEKILASLAEHKVNMLFIIGGPGGLTAAEILFQAARAKNQAVSIVGVPKSIDNDIMLFDRTFGFHSAVAEASEVIRNGWVEASSCSKGVGIVKLLGKETGFLATSASIASDIVDLCLIPEVKFKMEDIFTYTDYVLEQKGHMVIAVAEGAGRDLVPEGGDIGTFVRDQVNKYLKPKGGRSFYIDPSFIIRSCSIRPMDHVFCSRLAVDAVHTAMRGFTGVCIGPIHDIICMMPMKLLAGKRKHLNITRSTWQQCVQTCNMPYNLVSVPFESK